MFKKILKNAERGQAIVLMAFAMIGLVAMVGLMTDTGILLIEYAKLKRGIDSAAIASAQQFRRGFTGADLATAAQQFLILNQSTADNIIVYRCKDTGVNDGTVHDATLCTTPRRKLVRIDASRTVTFGFLRVIGINSTVINASSVGEAASIDLVLVIDTSASMSYETGGNPNFPDHPSDDPAVCNFSSGSPCEPLNTVKNVADEFMDTMFFPYDRVSIIAMTSQTPGGSRDHVTVLPLTDNEATVRTAIGNLKVYQPPSCNWSSPASPTFGPCLNYPAGSFVGLDCPLYRYGPDLTQGTADDTTYDISSCNSSNIGGALLRAAAEFSTPPIREDSFWVVIALAGGPANATDSATGFPYGYCPPNTWNSSTNPFCRDASANSRHGDGDANYDADDFARDAADYLADPVNGQGVTVFTIGLGNLIRGASKGDADAGEKLLQYIAETAGDSTGVTANHGAYFYSPDSAGLDNIFAAIAANIFTRISK
ncbi:MAG: hypothetical protein JNM46_04590 [Anaerolineales bacterium]|nr:hypothetical protein [Anaerolineales bacterium]